MISKNLIIAIFALAVIGLTGMWLVIYQQNKVLEGLDQKTLMLTKQSTSDEPEEIEEDLEDTELESLDQELADIERELE